MKITDDHIATWRRQGYVLVPDYVDQAGLEQAREEAYRGFPRPEEYHADPSKFPQFSESQFNFTELPYKGDLLNELAVEDDVLEAVEKILETDDIILATSILWAKYGSSIDYDQELHVDYRNNTLLHPTASGRYALVPFILYLTDVTLDSGPTFIVSEEVTGGDPNYLAGGAKSRDDHPELYAVEKPVAVKAGTLLMYSMRAYHRGSRMTDPLGHRLSLHFVYRSSVANFTGWRAWGRPGQDPAMVSLIERLSPRRRRAFGIPPPGHDYWTAETLTGVGARYPEMDMTPYLEAAAVASR